MKKKKCTKELTMEEIYIEIYESVSKQLEIYDGRPIYLFDGITIFEDGTIEDTKK